MSRCCPHAPKGQHWSNCSNVNLLRRKPSPLGRRMVKDGGAWREGWQCGLCGSGHRYSDRTERQPSLAPPISLRKVCKGVYLGRPGGRCGWLMTRVWLWVPKVAP
jgi:hypothetical protein